MKKNRLSIILLATLVLLICFFIVACNDSENGGGHVEYYDVQGYVRTVDFQNVAQAKICYNGAVKSTADNEGKFTISVQREDFDLTTGKITIEDSSSLTYFDYKSQQFVIIKIEEGMEVTDFCFLSGKVVEYYNGEIAVDDSVLKIDDTIVKTFTTVGNDRNFNLAFVHKDSVVSAYKEGYTCHLEVYGPVITGVRVKDISTTSEIKELYVNGENVTLKELGGGFTFRLKSADGE